MHCVPLHQVRQQFVVKCLSAMISRAYPPIRKFPRPLIFNSVAFAYSTATSSSSSSSTSFLASTRDSTVLTRLNHKDWLTPKEVLTLINSLTDPSSAIIVLELYSKRKDYKPNEPFYLSIILKLAHAKMFDAIDNLMHRIKLERNCRLSDDFFYNVIKVYGNMAGRINKAIETLYDMPKFPCWPSTKTFNFVLNLLVSTKLLDVAYDVYTSAPKLGVEIDACCLNILIKGLCNCGKLEAAFQVLDEFPKIKCEPNVRTFSTLMHALCEQGKLDDAFLLLDRMEMDGIWPDTIVFNILISGLRKQGRVEQAKELLERMQLKGCAPTASSYQEVLYGLLDAERFAEAKHLMNHMVLMGITPSFVSYRVMIQGLCKLNLLGDVNWAVKQMVQQGFVPKMGMWKLIVRAVVSQGPPFQLESFLID
ncbi:pentatricopeptide repeat-containing protein At3g14580, mitochondrial [Neltuma alba]|uniref:pentatricopeptide repeat-containing protein At3g14580, mitochondrial n=1 Tax=Neltuma alba TaxID=207710 RepID=UPI0010A4C017|nr:pentatricopeptide repeat-containing protein At3g14580, mitochondrial [Prosopis alba]